MTGLDPTAAARRAVARAKRRGVAGAEAFVQVQRTSAVRVRDGEVEALEEATSKGLGLRVFARGRLGFAYTSDFSAEAIDETAAQAIALARSTSPDPRNRLPDRSALAPRAVAPDLYDPAVAELPTEWLIAASRAIERAARGHDPRVVSFDSLGAGARVGEAIVASSAGLFDRYAGTSVYLYASPVAGDGSQLQTGYWYDSKRHLADLEDPESVGRTAAARAVRMLGARQVPTQRAAVVLDPMVAADLVAGVVGAASGELVNRRSSFLAGKKGERIASALLTIVDDGLYPRGQGAAPFDGEGVPCKKTPIVTAGVLEGFLYDSFHARKARTKTTGNAWRSYATLPQVAPRHVVLAGGRQSAESIVRSTRRGLYVTAMLGRGLNVVTGEFSRGANGLWIENGEFAHPVQAVTVAGPMIDLLRAVDAVGDDLSIRSTVNAPTLRIAEGTIGGA